MAMVTDDMIQNLMYNSLTIGVFGMIESKKKTILKGMELASDF